MKRWQKFLISLSLLLMALILVGPFLIPVPPLENTVPPAQLAEPDSQFVEVNDLTVHYKETGSGEPVFVLLHGFGASLFSWREVMAPLSQFGRVIAFDRPAFGLTERPLPGEWDGQNPYSPEAQVDLVIGLLDALGVDQAILVGNSAGGTVALNTTLAHPERVQGFTYCFAVEHRPGEDHTIPRPAGYASYRDRQPYTLTLRGHHGEPRPFEMYVTSVAGLPSGRVRPVIASRSGKTPLSSRNSPTKTKSSASGAASTGTNSSGERPLWITATGQVGGPMRRE